MCGKSASLLTAVTGGVLMLSALPVFGMDGVTKRGCVYYDRVCSACHMEVAGEMILTTTRTMREWQAYFEEDHHDASGRSVPSVRYYVSHEYRMSIKETNEAARKVMNLTDDQLLMCVREFLVMGARDADRPPPRRD